MLLLNILVLLFWGLWNWTHQLGRRKNLSFSSCPTCPDAPFQARPTSSILFYISAPDFANWWQGSCSSWWTAQIWKQLPSSNFEHPLFFFSNTVIINSPVLFFLAVLENYHSQLSQPQVIYSPFCLTGRIIALYFGCLHAAFSTYLLIRWHPSFPSWAVGF